MWAGLKWKHVNGRESECQFGKGKFNPRRRYFKECSIYERFLSLLGKRGKLEVNDFWWGTTGSSEDDRMCQREFGRNSLAVQWLGL